MPSVLAILFNFVGATSIVTINQVLIEDNIIVPVVNEVSLYGMIMMTFSITSFGSLTIS
jgi:hypothetical protein